jgi:hypothetical protein
MAAQFKKRLQAALDRFDLNTAENLSEEIYDAELHGYTPTAQEEKLWERLVKCVQAYRRTMASL